MIRVGIVGGAGYTAGELLSILVHHPHVEITFAHSASQAGKPLHAIHADLAGEIDQCFTDRLDFSAIDALFLCSGHGQSRAFMARHAPPADLKVIDLSHDYRLKATSEGFVYGLPELNLKAISSATQVANPGCFATAITLGILPLAHAGALANDVHVHAITGSTGAGQQPSPTTHFSWRSHNLSIYKPFSHQHLGEINQSVRQLQPTYEGDIKFLPLRGNFTRGIFASLYTRTSLPEEKIKALYQAYYQSAPFVHITEQATDLKQALNTNKCLIYVEKHHDTVLITSVIDNLTKGASGQAVQNMNLLFGLAQTDGLRLKGSRF